MRSLYNSKHRWRDFHLVDNLPLWVTPNFLTTLRILLAGIAALVYYYNLPVVALVLYVLAIITDYWDGNVARRRKQITDFGKILDPLADKILNIGFLWILGWRYGGWLLNLITAETIINLLLASGGFWLWHIKIRPGANRFGKLKTVMEILAILALFLNWPLVALGLVTAALILSLGSLTIYWKDVPEKYYANLLTVSNLALGIIVIILAVLKKIFNRLELEPLSYLIYIAMLLDSLDGLLARKLGGSSTLGVHLDSWADFLSFGVAPMVLMVVIILFTPALSNLIILAYLLLAIMYAICLKYRLDRYRQGVLTTSAEHSDYFHGLPSPAAAGVVVPALMATEKYNLAIWPLVPLLILLSYLMVSKHSYPHLGEEITKKIFLYPLIILSVFALRYQFIHLVILGLFTAYLVTPWLNPRR